MTVLNDFFNILLQETYKLFVTSKKSKDPRDSGISKSPFKPAHVKLLSQTPDDAPALVEAAQKFRAPKGIITKVCRVDEKHSTFPAPRTNTHFEPIPMSESPNSLTGEHDKKKLPTVRRETVAEFNSGLPDSEYSAENVSRKVYDFLEIDEPDRLSPRDNTKFDSRASPIPREEIIKPDSPRFEYYEEIKYKDPGAFGESPEDEELNDPNRHPHDKKFQNEKIGDIKNQPLQSTTHRYIIKGVTDPQKIKQYKYVRLPSNDELEQQEEEVREPFHCQPASRTQVRTIIRRRIIQKVVKINGVETVTNEVVEEPVEQINSTFQESEIDEVEKEGTEQHIFRIRDVHSPTRQQKFILSGIQVEGSKPPEEPLTPSIIKSNLRPEAMEFTPRAIISQTKDITHLDGPPTLLHTYKEPKKYGFIPRETIMDDDIKYQVDPQSEKTLPPNKTTLPQEATFKDSTMVQPESPTNQKHQRRKKKKRREEDDTKENDDSDSSSSDNTQTKITRTTTKLFQQPDGSQTYDITPTQTRTKTTFSQEQTPTSNTITTKEITYQLIDGKKRKPKKPPGKETTPGRDVDEPTKIITVEEKITRETKEKPKDDQKAPKKPEELEPKGKPKDDQKAPKKPEELEPKGKPKDDQKAPKKPEELEPKDKPKDDEKAPKKPHEKPGKDVPTGVPEPKTRKSPEDDKPKESRSFLEYEITLRDTLDKTKPREDEKEPRKPKDEKWKDVSEKMTTTEEPRGGYTVTTKEITYELIDGKKQKPRKPGKETTPGRDVDEPTKIITVEEKITRETKEKPKDDQKAPKKPEELEPKGKPKDDQKAPKKPEELEPKGKPKDDQKAPKKPEELEPKGKPKDDQKAPKKPEELEPKDKPKDDEKAPKKPHEKPGKDVPTGVPEPKTRKSPEDDKPKDSRIFLEFERTHTDRIEPSKEEPRGGYTVTTKEITYELIDGKKQKPRKPGKETTPGRDVDEPTKIITVEEKITRETKEKPKDEPKAPKKPEELEPKGKPKDEPKAPKKPEELEPKDKPKDDQKAPKKPEELEPKGKPKDDQKAPKKPEELEPKDKPKDDQKAPKKPEELEPKDKPKDDQKAQKKPHEKPGKDVPTGVPEPKTRKSPEDDKPKESRSFLEYEITLRDTLDKTKPREDEKEPRKPKDEKWKDVPEKMTTPEEPRGGYTVTTKEITYELIDGKKQKPRKPGKETTPGRDVDEPTKIITVEEKITRETKEKPKDEPKAPKKPEELEPKGKPKDEPKAPKKPEELEPKDKPKDDQKAQKKPHEKPGKDVPTGVPEPKTRKSPEDDKPKESRSFLEYEITLRDTLDKTKPREDEKEPRKPKDEKWKDVPEKMTTPEEPRGGYTVTTKEITYELIDGKKQKPRKPGKETTPGQGSKETEEWNPKTNLRRSEGSKPKPEELEPKDKPKDDQKAQKKPHEKPGKDVPTGVPEPKTRKSPEDDKPKESRSFLEYEITLRDTLDKTKPREDEKEPRKPKDEKWKDVPEKMTTPEEPRGGYTVTTKEITYELIDGKKQKPRKPGKETTPGRDVDEPTKIITVEEKITRETKEKPKDEQKAPKKPEELEPKGKPKDDQKAPKIPEELEPKGKPKDDQKAPKKRTRTQRKRPKKPHEKPGKDVPTGVPETKTRKSPEDDKPKDSRIFLEFERTHTDRIEPSKEEPRGGYTVTTKEITYELIDGKKQKPKKPGKETTPGRDPKDDQKAPKKPEELEPKGKPKDDQKAPKKPHEKPGKDVPTGVPEPKTRKSPEDDKPKESRSFLEYEITLRDTLDKTKPREDEKEPRKPKDEKWKDVPEKMTTPEEPRGGYTVTTKEITYELIDGKKQKPRKPGKETTPGRDVDEPTKIITVEEKITRETKEKPKDEPKAPKKPEELEPKGKPKDDQKAPKNLRNWNPKESLRMTEGSKETT
ncbi:hypothetical protein RUM43_009831 [Polyplax serrata]|uniref:Uncharacterized protein n=1 Tax=Polyplax serrata TaxID=468196 RepID=A0AAN8S7P8_POLSC